MTYEQASRSVTSLPISNGLQDVLIQSGVVGVGRLTRATPEELQSYGVTQYQVTEIIDALSPLGLSLAMDSWESKQ